MKENNYIITAFNDSKFLSLARIFKFTIMGRLEIGKPETIIGFCDRSRILQNVVKGYEDFWLQDNKTGERLDPELY